METSQEATEILPATGDEESESVVETENPGPESEPGVEEGRAPCSELLVEAGFCVEANP